MSAALAPDSRRVAALFDVLADLDPAAAEQRLADECSDDPALRDAVRRLLARDRSAPPGFLAPRPALLAGLLRGQDPGADNPDEVGRDEGPLADASRLGRYAVMHRLAAGGMGVVYVGYDETLDRRVALKVLHRGASVREWLLREGQALGRLAHPNVVPVHEVGEQDGRVFLAMEFIEGPTLSAWLGESPRPFADALHLFLQAGRGLCAAHRAGIVHRDFKPDNVLIGKDGRARVVDFGIAALAHAGSQTEATDLDPGPSALAGPLTQTGVLLGTPAFMSPEQFCGGRATPLSDQFSFCVALYRAAYGASPHPDGPLVELAHSVLHEPPAPPPRRPEVPRWLGPILLRGLARDPQQRFPSMDDLLGAIAQHLPRDPELDDTPIVRERRILSLVFIGGFGLAAGPLVSAAAARVLLRPAALLALPALILLATLLAIAALWRGLSRNRYGRRMAGLFPLIPLALLWHRLIALGVGLSAPQLLVEDMGLLVVLWGVIAHTFERWMFWLAAGAAVPAVLGALRPEQAPLLAGLLGIASAVAMIIRMIVGRHRSCRAIVRPYEDPRDAGSPRGGAGQPG